MGEGRSEDGEAKKVDGKKTERKMGLGPCGGEGWEMKGKYRLSETV